MNTGADAADMMVRESIQITESAVKLAGLGAKNLAALLIALANDNQKLQGQATLKRLLQDNKELRVFPMKTEDIKDFRRFSKEYGIMFHPIVNKIDKSAFCDMLIQTDDIPRINRILEKMGYPSLTAAPREERLQKNSRPLAPSENSLTERGSGLRETVGTSIDKRLSVREQIEGLKEQKKQQAQREQPAPQKHKAPRKKGAQQKTK